MCMSFEQDPNQFSNRNEIVIYAACHRSRLFVHNHHMKHYSIYSQHRNMLKNRIVADLHIEHFIRVFASQWMCNVNL